MTTLKDQIETALGDGQWHKLDDLITRLGGDEVDGRKVRAAISDSGDFISNSVQGYRLTRYATSEEIQHSLNDLRSRAADLERRARAIQSVAIRLPRAVAAIEHPMTDEEMLSELLEVECVENN